MDERLSEVRQADYRVPYWDATLWEWTNVLPPVKLRSFKAYAGFLRRAEGRPTHEAWTSVSIPGGFLFGAKNLDVLINEDSTLCTGKDWRAQPRCVRSRLVAVFVR
jgi:hypothetical protein